MTFALPVLREVSDVDGDEVTVALMGARSTSEHLILNVADAEPVGNSQLALGHRLDVVLLSGGVLHYGCQLGAWTATLVVSDSCVEHAGWVSCA